MAHQLKLHIWKLGLKPRGENRTDNEELFNRIIAYEDNPESAQPYSVFLDHFVRSFNGEFHRDARRTKAFAPVPDKISIHSDDQLIHGFLQGGPTGIKQSVKDNNRFIEEGTIITENQVVGLEYYFLLWIPQDVDYMYVMMQSYSDVNHGIATPFFDHLKRFLSYYRYSITTKEGKVPESIQNAFLDRGVVVGLDVTSKRTSRGQRNQFSPSLADQESTKVRVSISSFELNARDFIREYRRRSDRNPFYIDLTGMGIDDPREYQANIRYKDPMTKKLTSATITDLMNVRPTIVVPDSIKTPGGEVPDMQLIYDFCMEHLTQLKREDQYTPLDD